MRDYWIWMAGAPSPCLPADATAQGVSPCRYTAPLAESEVPDGAQS